MSLLWPLKVPNLKVPAKLSQADSGWFGFFPFSGDVMLTKRGTWAWRVAAVLKKQASRGIRILRMACVRI